MRLRGRCRSMRLCLGTRRFWRRLRLRLGGGDGRKDWLGVLLLFSRLGKLVSFLDLFYYYMTTQAMRAFCLIF